MQFLPLESVLITFVVMDQMFMLRSLIVLKVLIDLAMMVFSSNLLTVGFPCAGLEFLYFGIRICTALLNGIVFLVTHSVLSQEFAMVES